MSNFKNQTMKSTLKLLAILFISSLAFVGCSSDDDDDHDGDHDHDHEEINILRYTLTNGNDVVTLTFTDLDGEGGADGTFEVSGALSANTTYTGALELLHEEEDGEIDNIGAEIAAEEADEHEVFYITNITGLNVTTTDVDEDSNPLGFNTTVTTGAAGTGLLTVTVVHEGKKPNDGTVDDALIGTDEGPGSIDITVTFSVQVQ